MIYFEFFLKALSLLLIIIVVHQLALWIYANIVSAFLTLKIRKIERKKRKQKRSDNNAGF